MGVGVAGLQAIATARRLGAVVTATDVRPAVKEQVASLGAKFLAVEDEEFKAAETAGGYAKEMSKEYQAKQAALVADHIAKQDIVITTALIPGRPAPRLVTREMYARMRQGSVLIDLAVERGGNVEGAVAGKITEVDGVKIVGHLNVAGRIAATASQLYAKNLLAFVETLVDKDAQDHQDRFRRRTGQGHRSDAWRQGGAPELRQCRNCSVSTCSLGGKARRRQEGCSCEGRSRRKRLRFKGSNGQGGPQEGGDTKSQNSRKDRCAQTRCSKPLHPSPAAQSPAAKTAAKSTEGEA